MMYFGRFLPNPNFNICRVDIKTYYTNSGWLADELMLSWLAGSLIGYLADWLTDWIAGYMN